MAEPLTAEQVDRIIGRWSTFQDTWQGDSGPSVPFDYPHEVLKSLYPKREKWRALPEPQAALAREYIAYLCRRYPLQLRSGLGLAMWLRFTDVWADTGDPVKSMRAI